MRHRTIRASKLLGRFIPPMTDANTTTWKILGFTANEVIVLHPDEDGAPHISWYPLVPVR